MEQTLPAINNEKVLAKTSLFSITTLLFANIITIVLFIQSNGSIMQVLWSYWVQSIIIGAINVVRILKLPQLSTPQSQTEKLLAQFKLPANMLNIFAALFFIFHYGWFHLGYLFFLTFFSSSHVISTGNGAFMGTLSTEHISVVAIILSGVFFAIHHIISFLAELKLQKNSVTDLNELQKVFSGPYARIIPMHIIIIIGPVISIYFGSNAIFVVFMVLKTLVDLLWHKRGISHPKVIYK